MQVRKSFRRSRAWWDTPAGEASLRSSGAVQPDDARATGALPESSSEPQAAVREFPPEC